MTPFTSILIVDDEPAVRELMSRWATSIGMAPQTAGSADEALETLHDHHCDLAVVDVRMPGRDGLWLAEEMRREHPRTAVVLATGYTELLNGRATTPPVADLMLKPFNRERFIQAIDRGREWHDRARAEVAWHDHLLEESGQRVLAARAYVSEQGARGVDEVEAILELLARQIPDVLAHSQRVCEQAAALARALELDEATIAVVAEAGLLHDIGKLAVPEALLTSRAQLRSGEIALLRRHAEVGSDILADTVGLQDLAPIVRAAHESFGGGGHPDGLAGVEIPVASRIIAVVNAYDAMINDAGGERYSASSAAAELLQCSPREFDPEIVIPFLVMLGRP